MKRSVIAVLTLGVLAVLAENGLAQGNPRGTTKISVQGKTISVEYGRPSLKGRSVADLLQQLKPGDFWRVGADKSTTFSTTADLQFGDVSVPKGEYSLWAQREADNSWKLIFNKQYGQWGTEHEATQDLPPASLKETKASQPAEMVTITLVKRGRGGVIVVQWGDLQFTVHFKVE
jgi:hypothetical protein